MFNYNVGNTARKLETIKNAHVMPVNENANSRQSMINMNMGGNMNNMNINPMSPSLNQNPPKMNVNQMLDNDQVLNRNQTGMVNNNLGGTGNTFFKASQNLPRGTISANNIPVNINK